MLWRGLPGRKAHAAVPGRLPEAERAAPRLHSTPGPRVRGLMAARHEELPRPREEGNHRQRGMEQRDERYHAGFLLMGHAFHAQRKQQQARPNTARGYTLLNAAFSPASASIMAWWKRHLTSSWSGSWPLVIQSQVAERRGHSEYTSMWSRALWTLCTQFKARHSRTRTGAFPSFCRNTWKREIQVDHKLLSTGTCAMCILQTD